MPCSVNKFETAMHHGCTGITYTHIHPHTLYILLGHLFSLLLKGQFMKHYSSIYDKLKKVISTIHHSTQV